MPDWLAQARALHAESIVVDGHADTPQRFADESWDWTAAELCGGQISAATARDGGLHGEFFALWAEPGTWDHRFVERTFSLLDAVEEQVRRHQMAVQPDSRYPGRLALCTTADQVRQSRAAGCFAALLGIEGGHSIANDLDLLREFYGRGVRYMTLTWNNTNDWCDSSGDVERHGGLTRFGYQVIAEMNRLGMLVDLSHVSDASFWQAIRASRAPVIASHSAARALTNAARNLTDEMLCAVAESGGVVMVNFFAAFVCEDFRLAWNVQRPDREVAIAAAVAANGGRAIPFNRGLAIDRHFSRLLPRPPLSMLIDHFDHILRVCGPAHVGIGSDFDGIPLAPQGIDSAASLPKITAGLLARGWSAENLRGMLGENILRVLHRAAA